MPNPDDVEEGKTFKDYLNPSSLEVLPDARVEPSVAQDPDDTRYQFERQGYFIGDAVDSQPDRLVFNRVVALRDSWAKREGRIEVRGQRSEGGGQKSEVSGQRSEGSRRASPQSKPKPTTPEVTAPRDLAATGDASAALLVIDELLVANPDKVAAYRAGKTGLLGFFVGQVMRALGDKANPQVVSELVQAKLME